MSNQNYLIKVDNTADIQNSLSYSWKKGFSGLVTSIASESNKRDLLNENLVDQKKCFSRTPLIFSSREWLNITPYLKITSDLDSQNENVRKNYEIKLIQEFNYALHVKPIGLHYIKATCKPETLGKFIMSLRILDRESVRFCVEIRMVNYKNYTKVYFDNPPSEDYEDPWNYWNELHKATNYNQILEVALVLSTDLPDNEIEIYRWLGEPVSMLVIPHSSFVTNKSNFPMMNKQHQEVVKLFMQYQKCLMVVEPKSIKDHQVENYLDYLKHLYAFVDHCDMEEHKDALKYPLQPLYDNLDFGTYETFERDPAKYILYQKAIEEALKDMILEEEKETKKLILLLVGAGRGPLIRSALNASKNTNRKIKILAVEKNPNAIVTLSCLIRDLWPDEDIELIAKDMRTIKLNENADIIVSELMGSIGDNELSPECLDGVQHLLKPTGISIPCNSKSYVQPIMSKRTYSFCQKRADDEPRKREKYSEYTEINWLIYMTNFFHIDITKELFLFNHPNYENPIDNTRYKKLTFESSIDCVLHGFSGYFSSQLYKDIEISIVPESHTQGMASWYSSYFPVSKPMQLTKGQKIELEFWRKLDATKVWYEWKVTLPDEPRQETIIHNLNGDIHPILL